ncbi:hypothetical protein ACM16X_02470 [Haloarcula japonica]|uniref:hypothetical protein n=1 Tax=Haloarcula japonica TaxID=29282 RepID=UPI0039F68719
MLTGFRLEILIFLFLLTFLKSVSANLSCRQYRLFRRVCRGGVSIDDVAESDFDELIKLRNRRDAVAQRSQREPYVLNLRNPWDGEMHFELEDPYHHQIPFYDDRIQELAEEIGIEDTELLPVDDEEYGEGDPVPDGGRKYFFGWVDEHGNLLYDKSVNGDSADCLYESVDDAVDGLETLMSSNPDERDRYRNSNLYKFKKMDKEMEGLEVDTEQAGLGRYQPDGGRVLTDRYDQDLQELAEAADELNW